MQTVNISRACTVAKSIASILIKCKKPGLLPSCIWKPLATSCGVSENYFLIACSDVTQAPLCTAFVSNNIYLFLKQNHIRTSMDGRPVAFLISSLMSHGEVGLDKLVGVFESQTEVENGVINLLSRKVKLLTDQGDIKTLNKQEGDEASSCAGQDARTSTAESSQIADKGSIAKIGNPSSNLLKHATKRTSLLELQTSKLSDHAWIGCGFSYSSDGVFSSGSAARTQGGAIYRAGAIDRFVSARDAVTVSLVSNGESIENVIEWSDCDSDSFKEHPWFDSEFKKFMINT